MKWSQMKRILSLTLCVLMVLALLPTSTLAEDAAAATETSAPASDPAPVSKEQPASDPAPASDPTPASEPSAAGSETPADASTPALAAEANPTPSAEVTNAAEATPSPEISATPTATPKMYVVNFVIDGETDSNLQQTAAAIHDPARMRQAGAELLSLALIDARNHTLRWLAAFEPQLAALPVQAEVAPPLWLVGHAAWFQERWIARNVQRQRGAGQPEDDPAG